MDRKENIRSAYRLTGSNSFYDGMITCSTAMGKAVCRLVWGMNRTECDADPPQALSGIPEGFSGLELLEVPVGTGILTMPLYQTLPRAEVVCVDYSPDMMAQAQEKAERLKLRNVSFQQGDVGAAVRMRGQQLRHRPLAQRFSRISGQGGRLSRGLPRFKAGRDVLLVFM